MATDRKGESLVDIPDPIIYLCLVQAISFYSYLLLGLWVADCQGESLVDISDPIIYIFLDADNDILFLPT